MKIIAVSSKKRPLKRFLCSNHMGSKTSLIGQIKDAPTVVVIVPAAGGKTYTDPTVQDTKQFALDPAEPGLHG